MIDPTSIAEPVAPPEPAAPVPAAGADAVPAAGAELVLPPPLLELLQAAAVRTTAATAPMVTAWAARRARPRAPPAVLLPGLFIFLAFR